MRSMSRHRRILVALAAVVAGAVVLAAVVAAVSAPTVSVSSPVVSGPLHSDDGPFLTDDQGRVVILHGVNAVYKRSPYELTVAPGRPNSLTAKQARKMASLGFNVVRLGIIWEGLEPGTLGANSPQICAAGAPQDPHQFDAQVAEAYLAQVRQVVDMLAAQHIYTILDMHEDIYSSEFGGEGAPPWAVCTDGHPILHLPGRWSNQYNDPALLTAVAHFWANDVQGDLQGEYDRVWSTAASYFRDDPWVVGFDPINEPFTKTLESGRTQVANRLECFYTGRSHPGLSILDGSQLVCPPDDPAVGLLTTLRQADPDALIFFEPDIFSTKTPNDIGPMDYENLVFNFHDYCGFRSGKTGNPTDLDQCVDQEQRTMLRRSNERPDMATPKQPTGPAWFMSEFGATTSEPLMAELTDLADNLKLGWTYWAWKYYDDPTGSSAEALVSTDGSLSPVAEALSRPYPQAVAGTPVAYSFEERSDTFNLTYTPDGSTKPTVVFVPLSQHYPNGYAATVEGGTIRSPAGADHLVVTADPGATVVEVSIHAQS